MKTLLTACLAALLLSACATYPQGQVSSVDARPTLSINHAPAGSVLLVDGLALGSAPQYQSGQAAVKLEPGPHIVRIEQQGKVLLEQKVFLSNGSHKDLDLGSVQ